MKTNIHPAARLAGWLALLAAIQCLAGAKLFVACLLVPLAGARALRRAGRLIWRARWLLLTLLAIFAWGIAGEPLWDGGMAPSREGVDEALKHLGRLLLVLAAVAAFLEFMPLADLLAAVHAFSTPLKRLGVDADRGMVRLMLALRYVESLPRPRDWRSLLEVPETAACETIGIEHRAMRWIDACALAGLLAGLVMFCLL